MFKIRIHYWVKTKSDPSSGLNFTDEIFKKEDLSIAGSVLKFKTKEEAEAFIEKHSSPVCIEEFKDGLRKKNIVKVSKWEVVEIASS